MTESEVLNATCVTKPTEETVPSEKSPAAGGGPGCSAAVPGTGFSALSIHSKRWNIPKKTLTAASSGSEGAPAWSFALRRELRSHEVCSNVLAQTLSRSPRETSVSTHLTNSRSRSFMHRGVSIKTCPKGVPRPNTGVSSGSPEPDRSQGASKGCKAQAQGRMEVVRPQCQPRFRHRNNGCTNATYDRRIGKTY